MNDRRNKILLVDDDQALCELLSEFLLNEDFAVDYLLDGESAIRQLDSGKVYDAMVLDIMMPVVSGFEVLNRVKKNHDIPIIMLTGRGDDIDRILGLDMGADDYLGKPCNPKELAARLRALLRRCQVANKSVSPAKALHYKALCLHPETFAATLSGTALNFTQAEFGILQILMQNVGKVLSKSELTEDVLRRKITSHDRSIDVHISRIRQKLAVFNGYEQVIQSVRGIGYKLVVDVEPSIEQ